MEAALLLPPPPLAARGGVSIAIAFSVSRFLAAAAAAAAGKLKKLAPHACRCRATPQWQLDFLGAEADTEADGRGADGAVADSPRRVRIARTAGAGRLRPRPHARICPAACRRVPQMCVWCLCV
ncbi:hypothetical protein DAI22_03g221250 [Oryza sativa Japonica Group]|nr:hypothetical protein DAI22_03g221250 [Oryza sativa Japonica Group]